MWFLTGELVAGVLIPTLVCAALVLGLLWRRRERAALPIGGVLVLGLIAFGLNGVADLAIGDWDRVWVGVAVAAGGSALASSGPSSPLHVAAVLPGAILAVTAGVPDVPRWVQVAAVVSITVTGAGADRLERQHSESGLTMLMLLGSVAAVWLTVPETDNYSIVMLVAVGAVLMVWPWQLVRLGPGAGAAIWTVVTVLAMQAGVARDGAIIGAAGAGGVLLVGLLPTRVAGLRSSAWTLSGYRIVVIQAGLTFCLARVAGLRGSAVAATSLLVVLYAVAAVVAMRLGELEDSRSPVG